MIDPKTLDKLAKRFIKSLPDDVGQLSDELGQNLKSAFSAALAKTDLVTREEFDVQSAVLYRTREKLHALEKTVSELERRLEQRVTDGGSN